jgi:hypothetical protein
MQPEFFPLPYHPPRFAGNRLEVLLVTGKNFTPEIKIKALGRQRIDRGFISQFEVVATFFFSQSGCTIKKFFSCVLIISQYATGFGERHRGYILAE